MTSIVYTSFSEVEKDTDSGRFANEPELRHAFIEALKHELGRYCPKNLVEFALIPMLERPVGEGRRPDIRLGNLIIEVEPPKGDLSVGRTQLFRYMRDLAATAENLIVKGVVTNGVETEYYELRKEPPELKMRGMLHEVMGFALTKFCSERIPMVTSRDLVDILGV
jgi:hypothetical protein